MTASAYEQSRRERLIRKLVGLLIRGVYRKVDVIRFEEDEGGPRLSVSNHFGGFSDALLLVYAMQRVPRIMARDVIWRVPVVRSILKWAGAIPVHKPEDRGPGSNDIMFGSAYEALGEGSHLLIFPEGITRDEPSIAPLKTGAARIVLGARAKGVDGIQIAHAGIHYGDKASLRSSVSVLIGNSIDLDTTIRDHVAPGDDEGPENRSAVRGLTDAIESRLRSIAPNFADWEEARALTVGSEIVLRSLSEIASGEVDPASRDALAGYLGRRSADVRAQMVDAVKGYTDELSSFGLDDARLLSGITSRQLLLRSVGWLALMLLLLPFALVGAVINWIPYLVVKAVGLMRVAPAVFATIKPISALLAFGATWGLALWGVFREYGIAGAALAILLIPLYLAAVIAVVEIAQLLWASFTTWRRLRAARPSEGLLQTRRRELLAILVEAI